ncbi:MAG: RNA methyltransferase [Bacteroidota bacterium]
MRKLLNEELNRLSTEEFRKADKLPVVVILDNVRSLNNIGSIFRTCDAFRMEGIYLCGITATPPHKEIHKTALGATETVDWTYFEETREAVNQLRDRGYRVLAVEQVEGSLSLETFKASEGQGYGLVFGHEIRGVEQEVINICDGSLEIPQAGTKHSLNIAVSAGIVLWEVFRNLQQG